MERGDFYGLWGSQYVFTEYYDSASGLTTRFQNGERYPHPVDEFGVTGYIFDVDDCSSIEIKESYLSVRLSKMFAVRSLKSIVL